MKALQLDHAFIGIEDNKMNAVNHLKELVGDAKDITVRALRTRYPQGAEKQLIQAITGREVPPASCPLTWAAACSTLPPPLPFTTL